jgi:pyrroline-5-carboxylate reductase
MKNKIAILGGGNLGLSLATGLIKSGLYAPADITVTRRRVELIEHIAGQGIKVTSDNAEAVKNARIIFLTVKPQQAREVLSGITTSLNVENQIIISMVTGVGLATIREVTGNSDLPVFLAMPNTALSLCESMTCLAHDEVPENIKEEIEHLFNQLGKCFIIPEEQMGAATVLAACGVAFALRFLRSIAQGGVEIGFDAGISTQIAAQTLKGAARMAQESGNHPEHEIDRVTTPMGITISGLNEMEHNGFSSALIKGLLASYRKIESLNGGRNKAG